MIICVAVANQTSNPIVTYIVEPNHCEARNKDTPVKLVATAIQHKDPHCNVKSVHYPPLLLRQS